ncbi:putative RNA-directed DNA polymerase [Helianthus annuus]|nr:putative RNA-directed DNA polymerase [Helianthus annuus]KAJ0553180.1 putative RNA-directed DNA polymerase [Helianthus annuus]KAJ0722091.1 putative RNA-directed DNA polymerase [Helianthus annuus]KAJ0897435.1 putative RNA-directed DNA polymerase [Helianthus annuus]
MKLDDDTQAVVLLSSLPDSWSGFVTTVTETAGTGNLKFDRVRDSVLGEDVRRRNTSGGSTSGMLSVSKGRGKNRSSGSRGKSLSKAGTNVRCWNCGEKGHVKNECPDPKKEDGKQHVNSVVSDESDGDVLVCCEESIDSWAMDSGSSFHAIVNLKKGDFGKVRLANGHVLNVTGMGDVNLKTPLGTTWNLKNVRGLDVKFGGGKWKVIDGNLVVACGRRRGSLYLVEIPVEGVAVPVQHKVWFTESSKRKRVQFANLNPGAFGMSVEYGRGSKFKPVRGFGDSGSTGRVPGTITKNRWVLKTKVPTEEKSSPGNSLQNVESGINSRCISGAGGSCKPVEIENGSNKSVGLELVGASTGLSVT